MVSPLLSLPGAIASEDLGVAAHYGSPLPEQRSLEAGNAILDLSHRGIITVGGDDRLRWLHSMTSQDLLSLRPGESAETLLLDPNGRIEHAIRFVDDGERAWLLVDEGSAGPLTDFLLRMRFAMRVEVADVSDDYAALLAFEGGTALPVLRDLESTIEWHDPWASVQRGGTQYAVGDHPGAEWSAVQSVLPRTALAPLADRVTAGDTQAAGLLALEALEIRAWRPSRAGDADDRAIPNEFDWLRTAVHLNKGCYRGQETVAKVHNIGHPPRRLALLHLDGSAGELPVSGALVYRAGESAGEKPRPVGRITRAARHYEWGGIALALLKRALPADAPLEVRGGETGADPDSRDGETIAATQEPIVPTDAGATRDLPRLKRL